MSKLTVKRKAADLEGIELDWAVAKCEGYFSTAGQKPAYWESKDGVEHFLKMHQAEGHGVHWTHSSTDWSEAGAIIESESINLIKITDGPIKYIWAAKIECGQHAQSSHDFEEDFYYYTKDEVMRGPTPLIAAMRCYVESKLGSEVEIPVGLENAPKKDKGLAP